MAISARRYKGMPRAARKKHLQRAFNVLSPARQGRVRAALKYGDRKRAAKHLVGGMEKRKAAWRARKKV